jgi:hypothetical protein
MNPRPLPAGVERQVLVDEVDPVGESRELGRKLLQRGKALEVASGRAIDQNVVGDHRIPAVEFDPLERLIDLSRQLHRSTKMF